MIFNRRRYHGIANGYRSGFEESLAKQLKEAGVKAQYEEVKIKYVKPEKESTYTPDFVLPNGIIIESKGRFLAADREKHLLIKKQHPNLDIRFVFYRASTKITTGSKTTLAMWADKYGFTWAERTIPVSWLKEKRSGQR